MTKSSLARVRWQVTLVEHEPTKSPGGKLVDDIRKLSDEVHEVELLLESRELQKADFEDFSKQEDKLKVSFSEFSSGTKVARLFAETTTLILPSGLNLSFYTLRNWPNIYRPYYGFFLGFLTTLRLHIFCTLDFCFFCGETNKLN